MFGWLGRSRRSGRRLRASEVQVAPVRIRGRYDAAETTADNRRHWANADGLSADAVAGPGVEQVPAAARAAGVAFQAIHP